MHGCHQGGVTVDREFDSPKGGVKYIRKVCQLMGRCDSCQEECHSSVRYERCVG